MAEKQAAALNKSAAIRQALTQYPQEPPAAIARRLTEQHRVTFRPKEVSTIKAKVGHAKAVAAKPAAPTAKVGSPKAVAPKAVVAAARQTAVSNVQTDGGPATAGGIAEMVAHLQAYIRRLGKEELHRLIDTL
jgi:hypothetical protein